MLFRPTIAYSTMLGVQSGYRRFNTTFSGKPDADPAPKKSRLKKILTLIAGLIIAPKGGLGTFFLASLLKPYWHCIEPFATPSLAVISLTAITSGQLIRSRLPDDVKQRITSGSRPIILHFPGLKKALVIYHPAFIKKVTLLPKNKDTN